MSVQPRTGAVMTTATTAGTALTVTAGYGTLPKTAGDLYVAVVTAYGANSVTGITEGSGTWTQVASDTSQLRATAAVFVKTAAGADAAPVFSCTVSGTASHAIIGVWLAELFDSVSGTPQVNAANGAGTAATLTATSLPVASAGNVLEAGEYVLAGCATGQAVNVAITFTRGSGWTGLGDTGSDSTAFAHVSFDGLAGPAAGSPVSDTFGGWSVTNGSAAALVAVLPSGPVPISGADLAHGREAAYGFGGDWCRATESASVNTGGGGVAKSSADSGAAAPGTPVMRPLGAARRWRSS